MTFPPIIPAKAGIHAALVISAAKWIPAFAGMTIKQAGWRGSIYAPLAPGHPVQVSCARRQAGCGRWQVNFEHSTQGNFERRWIERFMQ